MIAPMTHPIIVPVVAGVAMTRRCLQSLRAQVDEQGIPVDVHLYVIDNGSRDVGPFLRTNYIADTLVRYSPMASLNVLWNHALAHVFEQGAEHALVVNNDTVLRPDTYRLLLADGGGFVTGVSVSDMAATTHTNPQSKSPHPSFSCFLIRRHVWDAVGPFDEQFWAYASDNCYHVRMHRAGIEAYAIDVPFFHEGSGTLKSVSENERSRLCKLADADRELFKKKYGCYPWDSEYAALFSPASFGVDSHVALVTDPSKVG